MRQKQSGEQKHNNMSLEEEHKLQEYNDEPLKLATQRMSSNFMKPQAFSRHYRNVVAKTLREVKY